MGGGSNDVLDFLNRRIGTVTNGPLTQFSSHHGGLSTGFTAASTQYIDTGVSGTLFQGLTELTISLWAYNTTAFNSGTVDALVGLGATSGSTTQFQFMHYSDNNLYVGPSAGGRVIVAASSSNWPSSIWTHYCWTGISGSTATLYVNGVSAGTASSTNFTALANTFLIGHSYDGSRSGYLELVQLWARALSAREIAGLIAEPYAGLMPSFAPFVGVAAAGGDTLWAQSWM